MDITKKIKKNFRKAVTGTGLAVALAGAGACGIDDPPKISEPRYISIEGPHEVDCGAQYSIIVNAEHEYLIPFISIRRGQEQPIEQETGRLRADFIAPTTPGVDTLNIRLWVNTLPVQGQVHDTTYTVSRR